MLGLSLLSQYLAEAPHWVTQSLPHVIIGLFVFAFGACVGSFLNVLVYRLPAGISVISPPSRCPVCGWRLTWRENLPIIGWLLLRGRCRRCGVSISPQYITIEALTGAMFLLLYLAYFAASPGTAWWGNVGGPWWYINGPWQALPAFLLHAGLLAALLAMTLIDARTFTIPIQIPTFIIVLALVVWPLQGMLTPTLRVNTVPPIPLATWSAFACGIGGLLGVVTATTLLSVGIGRPSFADYDEYVSEGETLGEYPHARREMLVELRFLAPVIAGLGLGWLVGRMLPGTTPPLSLAFLGGSVIGYLVGGGIVWAVRILGSLSFGREAMGMGDVHLLAAVGAVLGWKDSIWVFFLAPFFGLGWALFSWLLGARFASLRRGLPFGPHLAMAAVVVVFCRPLVNDFEAKLLGEEKQAARSMASPETDDDASRAGQGTVVAVKCDLHRGCVDTDRPQSPPLAAITRTAALEG